MIVLPEKLTKYINTDSRTFKAKIVTPIKTFEQEIMGFQLRSNFVPDNISFGYACSAVLEIQLYNAGNCKFQGAEFELFVGASIDRQMEYVSMGLFRTQKAQRAGGMTMITAYDRMLDTERVPYSTQLTFPASAKALIKELCIRCKFPFKDTLEEDVVIQENLFGGCTSRGVLCYLAGHYGKNVVINRKGELEFKWFADTDFVTNENRISEPSVRDFEYELGYIKCNNGKQTLETGNGENGFTFDCPTMTQERLDYLFKQRTPFKYNAVDFDLILGDLRLEVGDIITVNYKGESLRVPIMSINFDFDGGMLNRIVSYGKSEEEQIGVSITKKFNHIQNDVTTLNDITKATTALNDIVTNSLGLYKTSVALVDGSAKIYLHDKPRLEDSFTIYTVVEGGFAFTKSGWNNGKPVWQYGVDKDGNTVLNTIVANALTAVHITGGLIEGTTVRGNEIIGGTITGTTINGGRLNAISGGSYFDLNNGKLYTNDATLKGTFEVTPTATTSLQMRHGIDAVRFINKLWNLDGHGVGWGSDLQLEESTSASFDYVKNGTMQGTVCFAESNDAEISQLGSLLLLGCKGLILEFGLYGNGRSMNSLTRPNDEGELVTYVDGVEKSKYTETGMTINGETVTDDLAFNSVEELKTNISETQINALDTIKKAKVYNYDLKKDKQTKSRARKTGERLGFVIGREVPKEMLGESGKTISIYNTIAMLTKAVQELTETAEMHTKRIDELTGILEKLQEKSTL